MSSAIAMIDVEITESLVGERVDRVVSLILEISRSAASDLVAGGQVSVDGRVQTKPSIRLELGQTLRLPEGIEPETMESDATVTINEVFVDDHVLIVEKPAGLVVHPGAGVDNGTLVQGVLARYPQVAGVGESGRPGIVHRLDRGTSGLLMVALTDLAYESLTEQLRNRTVERQYLALVHGLPAANEGEIDAPIGRSLRHPTRQTVRADGKAARTAYSVMERFEEEGAALVAFRLETGRTHQIRVHADAIGHPLVGDDRYGAVQAVHPVLKAADRPCLHARTLGFEHPASGEWMEFTSELPEDLMAILRTLQSTYPSG